jgi:hypothetical protein
MKRTTVAGATALAFLVALAPPAFAETESVNAAENVTRYDSHGDACGVIVDDYLDNEVNAYCFLSGNTWFKVRVPGVDGQVRSVRVARRGDCSGTDVSFTKRGDVVTVKVVSRGEFDCYFTRVSVRHTG